MGGPSWRERATAVAPLLAHADADGSGGETGIIETIFSELPTRAGFGVEFGQRSVGSGTLADFLSQRGWGALYLDREAVAPLQTQAVASGREITLARETVSPANINELFAKYGVPHDFDCLVIDIDGLDYWVWEALAPEYAPSLVIIEFNAHVGFGVQATLERDESWTYGRTKDYGASFAAMCALATRKGYRLVHVHGPLNLYFVRADLSFPEELTVKAPLGPEDLALLTDTEAFYDTFRTPGERPTWFGEPTPDVATAPWEILAPSEETQRVDLEGLAIEVLADKHDATWYQQRKAFEEKASALYPLICEEGFSTFVDIGASVGLVSILARRACPGIGIVAVEPDPRLARVIRRNFSTHGLDDAHVVNAIAGQEDLPSASFSLNPHSTLDNRVDVADWPQIRVPVVRIDSVLMALGGTGKVFFKIDTQGYEWQVLRGMEPLLINSAGWVLKMEFAPDWLRSQGTDPVALLDYLQERYEFVELSGRIPFGGPGLRSLLAMPIASPQHAAFVDYVMSLDRDRLGWVDLLVRPR